MRKKTNLFKKKFCVLVIAAIGTIGAVAPVAVNTTYAEETDKKQDLKNNSVGNNREEEIKQGWVKEKEGYKYYGKDGKPYTGWHQMGKAEGESVKHWSYFDKNGVLYTGWHKMGKKEGEKVEHWSYFGGNGWLRTGWKKLGKADGEKTEHWSYFGGNGWLRTGWVKLGKADGEKTEHWSYFGPNGWLRTNWQQMGKGTGNPDGNNAKHWSYFGPNGWLRTGMQDMGKGTGNPDGNAAKHKSYFGNNGWLCVNQTVTYKGVKYKADARGWLSALKNKIIVIDPGHQSKGNSGLEQNGPGSAKMKAKVSSGTQGVATGVSEYKLNLNVSLKLRDELERRGYTVYMTRTTHDVNITNMQRAQYANNLKADVLIHVHANGESDRSLYGAMTLCQTPGNPYNGYLYSKSRLLSDCVLDKYCKATGAKKIMVWETDTMTGINWSKVPVTTIELGYMTNPSEDRKMQDANYQKKMVTGIADGIDEYIRRL